ncbi:Uncharacterized protein RNJ44_01365 [Nakaseomyces bracarensis]|uniref:Uncharacterized protein n=1 Tax=Nakaseomyces bracarensis TaxID=273131 RepID=A0ABR4NPH5_9SACH
MTVYPDELVTRLCEEIAYEKGTVILSQLWMFAGELLGVKELENDLPMRRFVINSLCTDPEIILMDSESNIIKPDADIDIDNLDVSYKVSISEEKLWWVLTGGYSKKDSSIGNAAFQLLVEIAHSRTKGVNTIELAQRTKQDSRSVTGRIKKINHLVNSVQVVHKGHVVRNLKLRKFVSGVEHNEDDESQKYVRMKDHLAEIVEVVKNSKNGVRQIADLRRQLKFDKNKRLARAFTTAIAWLDEKNYLKKVMVVSPTNPSVTIRCVKYVNDYIPANEGGDINDYSDSDEQDISNDEAEEDDDDDEPSESMIPSNASKMLQGQDIILVQDQNNAGFAKQGCILNRFHPIQNQTFDMVESTGEKGLPTMDIVNLMTGKDYKRAFSKISDYFLVAKNSKSKSNGFRKDYKYQLTRLYDFEGKKKFFRLFTKDNFEALTQTQGDDSSKKQATNTSNSWKYDIKPEHKNIDTLTKENFIPLNATLRFTTTSNGEQRFFWNGELDVPPSENAPKLGRKRKSKAISESSDKENRLIKKLHSGDSSYPTIDDNNDKDSQTVLQIDGFSANSLRSLQRQKAIIAVLKKFNGISTLKEQFFEDLSRYMGSSTSLDKKTVRGDVDLMLSTNKLKYRIDEITQKKIIYLPEISQEKINDYIISEKDNKRVAFKDVLHDTEIYFYDQKAHDRFTRKARTAQRMRKYQNKSNKSTEPSNSTSVELFEARKTKRNAKKSKEKKISMETEETASTENNSGYKSFNISVKEGMEILIKAVIITKSIKNEIIWDKITTLFPSNSLENLKRKWTLRRIQIGQQGWKARVSKWRKVLLHGIKEETITLHQTEILDLPALLELWDTYEKESTVARIKLSPTYEENMKNFTYLPGRKFVNVGGSSSLAMSSMIQREIASLKQTHTINISDNVEDIAKEERQDKVKSIVRSILIEVQDVSKNEIDVLRDIPRDELDNIIMDMAKHKQLFLHGTKLKSTEILYEFLQAKGNFKLFERSALFSKNLLQMLGSSCGIVISEEFQDFQSWVIIDGLVKNDFQLNIIPMTRHIRPLTYTTRSFEIKTLTPPLLLTKPVHNSPTINHIGSIPVPLGKPYSKIWIDSQGSLRSNIWKSVIVAIMNEILFNPGINPAKLSQNCDMFIGKEEALVVCHWLESKNLIHSTTCNGFAINGNWHELFSY